MLKKVTITIANNPDQYVLPFLTRVTSRQALARQVRAHLKTLYPKLTKTVVYYTDGKKMHTLKIK